MPEASNAKPNPLSRSVEPADAGPELEGGGESAEAAESAILASLHQPTMGSGRLSPKGVMALQRKVGNHATQRFVQRRSPGQPLAPVTVGGPSLGAALAAPASPLGKLPPKLSDLSSFGSEPVESTSVVYPGKPAVQRLVATADFLRASNAGALSSRGATLREVDEWLAEYHTLPAPPTNASERDTKVSVIEEVIESTGKWLEENPNSGSASSAIQRRWPEVIGLQDEAKREKRTLAGMTFPTTATAVSNPDASTTRVQQQLTGDFRQSSERLAALIDLAVPQNNTSAELEVTLAVPVGSGVELGFRFAAEAEKDDKGDIEVGIELGVTAGGSIGIAKLQAEIGGFMEAKAGNAREVMQLLSYAMYQRFRESSVIPREVTNWMWGNGTSRKGQKLAERWAAGIEKNILGAATEDRERFVRRGMYGSVSAEGGVRGGKLGGKIKGRRFTEYTRESIERSTGGKKLADLSVRELANMRMPTSRGARASVGETHTEGVLSFEAEFGPFSGSAEYTMKADSSELELTAGASFNLLELGGGGAGGALVAYIGNMITRLTPMLEEKAEEDAEEDENAVANAANLVGDLASTVSTIREAVNNDPTIEFETFDPDAEPETSRKSEVGIEAGVKIEEEDFKMKEWEITLKAKQTRGIESPIISVAFEQGKLIKKWPTS